MPFIPQTSGKFVPVEDESLQEPTSAGKAYGKALAEQAGGVLGGWGGAEAGAALGAMTGPFALVAAPLGAVAGGIGGYFLGQKVQEKALEQVPESVKEKVGFDKEQRARERGEQPVASTLGEWTPAIYGLGTALPGIARGASRKILGVGTEVKENLANKLESWGFILSPAQVRRVEPIAQKGASSPLDFSSAVHNQNLANKLVTRGTGEESALVSKDFIAGRIDSLGKEFNKLYQGKDFQIDRDAIDAIQQIAEVEASAPSFAGTSVVKQAANEILESNRSLMQATGGEGQKFSVTGEGLQKLRNALTQRARSSGRADAHEIYNLVDKIDASVARNHPEIAKELEILRPKYRNSIILEDSYRAGHIPGGDIDLQRMGEMLRGKKGAVRMKGMDIDELGEAAMELKLSPLTRAAGESTDTKVRIGDVLRTTLGVVPSSLGLRSKTARAIQRAVSKEPSKLTKTLKKAKTPHAVAAGEVTTELADGEE
jgi:hypothetical protein